MNGEKALALIAKLLPGGYYVFGQKLPQILRNHSVEHGTILHRLLTSLKMTEIFSGFIEHDVRVVVLVSIV